MAKYDCEICHGRGRIRLPLYRRAVASFNAAPPEPEATWREYPCPECSDLVSVGQVSALREETFVAAEYDNDPRFIEHVKSGLARWIADQLLKDGYLKFRRGPDDEAQRRFQMLATVGVVHPSKLDILEQRIAERQEKVAEEVVIEAAFQIDNFGSHYGHTDILKRDARHLIGEALKTILKRRTKTL